MGIPGRGFPTWPPAVRREEQRRLEKEASQLLAGDRARRRQRAAAPKPKSAPEPPRSGWVNLGELRTALSKKGGRICLRKI
jgi:hypothetical protein